VAVFERFLLQIFKYNYDNNEAKASESRPKVGARMSEKIATYYTTIGTAFAMNYNGCKSKFNVDTYIKNIRSLKYSKN